MTAGTVLHRTKIPLTYWFWAAYIMTTDKHGMSALLLKQQLGLARYETAWMMLHKLRRAMVNAVREPLRGQVEVDDTWVGENKRVSAAADNLRTGEPPSTWWQWKSVVGLRVVPA